MRLGLALVAALIALPPAAAGPLEPQPDRVAFGTVRVGGVVEASVMLFTEGSDAAGLGVAVKPPPFVTVNNIQVGQRDYGPNKRVFCSFDVLLDTRKAGALKGDIAVEFAGGSAKVPVTADVVATRGKSRLLIVETPFQMYATGNADIYKPWLELVNAADLDVQYWLARAEQPILRGNSLENFDVVIVAEQGLFHARDEDRKRLKRFVELGGRVIVCANSFFRGSVDKVNEICKPFGVKLDDEEPPAGFGNIRLKKGQIVEDKLTKDVEQLDFYRPSPVTVTDPKKGKLLTRFDDGTGIVAVGRIDNGEMVVLGDSMWWNWLSKHPQSGNTTLFRNLVTK